MYENGERGKYIGLEIYELLITVVGIWAAVFLYLVLFGNIERYFYF